jgi:dynein heavy chain
VFLKELDTKKKMKIYPEEGNIYDYEFKDKESEWVSWTKSIENFEIDQKLAYHEIAIPTKDSYRNKHLIKILLQQNHHILTLGPTGTGKSLNNSELLTTGLSDTYQYISLVFSAQTGANQTQDTIDSKMEKRRKGYYGPPIGKKCIVFIDDLNMPKK